MTIPPVSTHEILSALIQGKFKKMSDKDMFEYGVVETNDAYLWENDPVCVICIPEDPHLFFEIHSVNSDDSWQLTISVDQLGQPTLL
jgi:hypothetical protein